MKFDTTLPSPGQIVDFIELDVERERHVVAHEFEAAVVDQILDILARSREEIVDAENFVSFREEPLAKMRAQKPGSACHQNPPARHQPICLISLQAHVMPALRSGRNSADGIEPQTADL